MKKSYADFQKQHVESLKLDKKADEIISHYLGEYPAQIFWRPHLLKPTQNDIALKNIEKMLTDKQILFFSVADIPNVAELKKIVTFLLTKQVEKNTDFAWRNFDELTPYYYLFEFKIRAPENEADIPVTAFIEEPERIFELFALLNNAKILERHAKSIELTKPY